MAVTKHGFQTVTSNRNDSDLSACRWLRAPATTEIDRLDQPQAVEHGRATQVDQDAIRRAAADAARALWQRAM